MLYQYQNKKNNGEITNIVCYFYICSFQSLLRAPQNVNVSDFNGPTDQ